jgi:hypothetical protein
MHQARRRAARERVDAEDPEDDQWNIEDDEDGQQPAGDRAALIQLRPGRRQNDEDGGPEPDGDLEQLRALDGVNVSDSCQLSAVSYQLLVSRAVSELTADS